jgi:AcrR family transcriptional regulator
MSADTATTRTDGEEVPAPRPQRADARRNRERLVAAARSVFAAQGSDASMEAVAREAGVGVGTLYRHFPRRLDLVEAVYRSEVDQLTVAAERAVAEEGPWDALVTWLHSFVRYADGKRTLLHELREAFEKHPELRSQSRERIDQAVDLVLRRAQEAGVARSDITGADLVQLLGPMCTNSAMTEDQAERLLGMVVDGLRPPD